MLRQIVSRHPINRNNPCIQRRSYVNVFAEFSKSVKRQIKENKEFQQNLKQIESQGNKIADSDAMQRAKIAMEKSKSTTSAAMKTVSTATKHVIDSEIVQKTVGTISDVSDAVGSGVSKVAEPIIESKAGKKVQSGLNSLKKDVIDTATTHRYIEYQPKEVREEARKIKIKTQPIVPENLEAGSNVIMHQESKFNDRWNTFKETNPVFQNLLRVKESVAQSENPIIEKFRDWFGGSMEETEDAQVVRAIQAVDPSFKIDKFMREAAEFYVPDVMEAYLRGDQPALQEWCSEQLYAQLNAGIESQRSQGLISDSRILDIRKMELLQCKMLDNDLPILLIEFNTQEVLIFRNKKGEIVVGDEDHIEHARYRMVFTKEQCVDPSIMINPRTNGWKAIEAVKIDSWAGI